MSITRHASGRWYFQFDRIIAGRRTRANRLLPKGWTRAQAQAFDQREGGRLFDVATGASGAEPLIDDAVLLYLEHRVPHLKNKDDITGALELLSPWYMGRRLSELPDVARDFAAKAKGESDQPLKAGTVRNRLAYLRAACRWAWKHHEIVDHDPTRRMTIPAAKNARHVYLTRAQMLAIARQMGLTWSRDVIRVAFYTGMRAGEILRSKPVKLDGHLALSIADSKNGLPRIIPVHPRIAHLVAGDWPPNVTVWTASKAFKAAARAVGLGHARLHDLRHSAASEMVNAGIDLFTVGGVLGHKSAVSTARYAHLAQERLRSAVGKIGQRRKAAG
jgi:integrase